MQVVTDNVEEGQCGGGGQKVRRSARAATSGCGDQQLACVYDTDASGVPSRECPLKIMRRARRAARIPPLLRTARRTGITSASLGPTLRRTSCVLIVPPPIAQHWHQLRCSPGLTPKFRLRYPFGLDDVAVRVPSGSASVSDARALIHRLGVCVTCLFAAHLLAQEGSSPDDWTDSA